MNFNLGTIFLHCPFLQFNLLFPLFHLVIEQVTVLIYTTTEDNSDISWLWVKKITIKEPVSTCVSLPGLWAALSFEGLSPKLAHTSLLAGGPAPLQPSAFFCWALSPQPLVFWSLRHASPSSCHTLLVSPESQLLLHLFPATWPRTDPLTISRNSCYSW